MTNDDLDRRIARLAADARTLVDDLSVSEPSLEQSVALGALTACSIVLHTLAGTVPGCEIIILSRQDEI